MTLMKHSAMRRARLFINLLHMDFKVVRSEFIGDLVNAVTWPASLALNFGYILPAFGMEESYGSFLMIGAMATTYFYLSIGFASELVSDFDGERFIDFQVTLPMPSYKMLIMQRVVSFALQATALSMPLLPIGKVILGNKLNLATFAPLQFVVVLLLTGIYFGFFALWLAAFLPNQRSVSNAWRRVYTPLLMAGCYWFSFAMGIKVFPRAALIVLLNPLTYMTEGIRSAVMGPEEYIPFLYSLLGVVSAIVLMGLFAMWSLRRRLDLL